MKIDLSSVRLVSLDDLERLEEILEIPDDMPEVPDCLMDMGERVYCWIQEVKGK